MGGSYTPDTNSRLFMNRAFKASKLSKADPEAALDAVLYSAVALEAFPNDFAIHIGIVENGDRSLLPTSLSEARQKLLELEKRRRSSLTKYQALHETLTGRPLNRSTEPWQDFDFLTDLRNELVHPKCGFIEIAMPPKYPEKTSKLITGLRSRKISHIHKQDAVAWPWTKHLQNPDAAVWAVNLATDIITIICRTVPRFKYSHWFTANHYVKPYAAPSSPPVS